MARASKLRVMISSRCNVSFPDDSGGTPLSDIRRRLKQEVEAFQVFGKDLFEVWINEETPAQGAQEDIWEVCIREARDCDILIALINGDAGWEGKDGGIGICHAELMTGLNRAPAKVRLIELGRVPTDSKTKAGKRNLKFQEYLDNQSRFGTGTVNNEDELTHRVKEALHDALLRLAQAGVREASKGRFHSGEALGWTKLDFQHRREAISRVLEETIHERTGSSMDGNHLIIQIAGTQVLVVPDAIPAALSVAAAKELVGQPFLYDHTKASVLGSRRGGPLHIIGCHRNATETQATKLLGFPDAMVVNAPFGIFVADEVQKIQFAFIANCRDESTTSLGVQRFFDWLTQTGEMQPVATRALARARIVKAIARENA